MQKKIHEVGKFDWNKASEQLNTGKKKVSFSKQYTNDRMN